MAERGPSRHSRLSFDRRSTHDTLDIQPSSLILQQSAIIPSFFKSMAVGKSFLHKPEAKIAEVNTPAVTSELISRESEEELDLEVLYDRFVPGHGGETREKKPWFKNIHYRYNVTEPEHYKGRRLKKCCQYFLMLVFTLFVLVIIAMPIVLIKPRSTICRVVDIPTMCTVKVVNTTANSNSTSDNSTSDNSTSYNSTSDNSTLDADSTAYNNNTANLARLERQVSGDVKIPPTSPLSQVFTPDPTADSSSEVVQDDKSVQPASVLNRSSRERHTKEQPDPDNF